MRNRGFESLPDSKPVNPYEVIKRVVNGIVTGKTNNVRYVEIMPNTTETIITDRLIGRDSFVNFIGLDENSLIGSVFLKEIDTPKSQFVIGHDSSVNIRKYRYAVIG